MIVRVGFDGSAVDMATARRLARVTDHAVVRWLERVEGRDIAALRRAILSNETIIHGMAIGAGGVQLPAFGVSAKLAGHQVVTIIKEGAA